MRDNKRFKNLDEQIEIFRYKGLIINNEEYAREVLLRENYFFINGYRHLFMKSFNNILKVLHLKNFIVYSYLIEVLGILYLNIYLL